MKYITILDFMGGMVYVRQIPDGVKDEDAMDYFAERLQLSVDNCQYMVTAGAETISLFRM